MELSQNKKGRFTLSVMIFSYWAMMCTNAFHSIFLQNLGFNSIQIGIIMGISYTFGMLFPPFFGYIADKTQNIKIVFLFSVGVVVFSSIAMPLTQEVRFLSLPLPTLLLPIYIGMHSSSYSLMDSWIISVCNHSNGQLHYSMFRLWGSLGYALPVMIVTYITQQTSISVPYLCGFLIGIFLINWSSRLEKPPYEEKSSIKTAKASSFLKNHCFLIFLLFSFVIHLTFTSSQNYMPWLIEAVNADKTLFGAISGFKVLFEAGTLFFGAKMVKKVPLYKILMLAGCLFFLENYLYCFIANSLFSICFIEILEGLGYGAFLVAAAQYVYELNPRELLASAQSLMVTVNFAGNIISSILGGWIIAVAGVRILFLITATCSLLVTLLFSYVSHKFHTSKRIEIWN